LYQFERLNFIEKQFQSSSFNNDIVSTHNFRLITQSISDQYDALISEFNSSCTNGLYYEDSERKIKRELDDYATKQKINQSAKDIMLSWNANFRFKE